MLLNNFIRWRFRGLVWLLSRAIPVKKHGNIERILALICGGLGDRLMSLPALRYLKKEYPKAHLCVAWMEGSLPVVNNEFNEIHDFKEKEIFSKLKLSLNRWDAVYVNIQGVFSITAELCSVMSRAPLRIGPRIEKNRFKQRVYTRPYAISGKDHITIINCHSLFKESEQTALPYKVMRAHSTDNVFRKEPGKKYIGINACMRRGHEYRRWPLVYFKGLIEKILQDDMEPIILYSSFEEKEMKNFFGDLPVKHCLHNSLEQLFDLICSCDVLVTSDTGPSHAAAAVETPVVVIAGPTDPCKTGPVIEKRRVVASNAHCSPCYYNNIECRDPFCLRDISVDTVYKAISELL
ncbi:MAG: glycosyltransferase family 9 protein [bacterium]